MAGELSHIDIGNQLTKLEWESLTLHKLDSQATGDIIYASSASQLSRLAIGAANDLLRVSGGIPAWGITTPIDLAAGTVGAPAYTMGAADSGIYSPDSGASISVSTVGVERFRVRDTSEIRFGTTTFSWGTSPAGADLTIRRRIAGVLKVDESFEVGGDVGFYGTTKVAQQTGVAVTAAGIHAALVNLGLITA